jgi:hypothetical protein
MLGLCSGRGEDVAVFMNGVAMPRHLRSRNVQTAAHCSSSANSPPGGGSLDRQSQRLQYQARTAESGKSFEQHACCAQQEACHGSFDSCTKSINIWGWGCIVQALQRGIICWVQHIGANRGVREMRLAVALVAAHGCTPLNSGCGWLGQAWPSRSV